MFPVLTAFLLAAVGLPALVMVWVALQLVAAVLRLVLAEVLLAGVELDLAAVVLLTVAPVVPSPWVVALLV